MTSSMTQLACEIVEACDNRYKVVLEVADIAKHLLDDQREKRQMDPFAVQNTTTEKVIYQALIMKSSEVGSGNGLIG